MSHTSRVPPDHEAASRHPRHPRLWLVSANACWLVIGWRPPSQHPGQLTPRPVWHPLWCSAGSGPDESDLLTCGALYTDIWALVTRRGLNLVTLGAGIRCHQWWSYQTHTNNNTRSASLQWMWGVMVLGVRLGLPGVTQGCGGWSGSGLWKPVTQFRGVSQVTHSKYSESHYSEQKVNGLTK